MATKIIKNIPLENVSEVKVKEESIIFERFNMIGNIFAQHNSKNLSIAHSYTQVSDEFLDEYIVNDNVVATIFTRRNDANIVDLLITYFDDKYVDFYRQNYYIHDLEITADLKRDIAFKVMKEYGRSSYSTDEQIEFITNKVFNEILNYQKEKDESNRN